MAVSQIKFTYNSKEYRVIDVHRFTVTDSHLQFSCSFLVTGASESAFTTNVAAALTMTKDFQAFLLKVGSTTVLNWSHSANTGMNTAATVSKAGSSFDSARSMLLNFNLEAEREPQNAARVGRRSARITLSKDTSALQTVRFSGIWTGISSGPVAAKDQYEAQAATWTATWLSTIGTDGQWQLLDESYNWDDENKILNFNVTYREVIFTSTPGEATEGIYTAGTWTRQDPAEFGAAQTANPVAMSGEYAGNSPHPQRLTVETVTYLTRDHSTHANPNTYWETYIRPWIVATGRALFGWGGRSMIFERHAVPVVDVQSKQIRCSAQILVVGSGGYIEFNETITRANNRNSMQEYIWDGSIDKYDILEGGRRLEVTQTIRIKKTSRPGQPPYLTDPPWHFLRETDPTVKTFLDPITANQEAWDVTFSRTYLYVAETAGRGQDRVTTPSPLGAPGGGGGGGVYTRSPGESGSGSSRPLIGTG